MFVKITAVSLVLFIVFVLLFAAIRDECDYHYLLYDKYPTRYIVLGWAVFISFLSSVVFGIIAIIMA